MISSIRLVDLIGLTFNTFIFSRRISSISGTFESLRSSCTSVTNYDSLLYKSTIFSAFAEHIVDLIGLEPMTSSLPAKRSSQLNYRPQYTSQQITAFYQKNVVFVSENRPKVQLIILRIFLV